MQSKSGSSVWLPDSFWTQKKPVVPRNKKSLKENRTCYQGKEQRKKERGPQEVKLRCGYLTHCGRCMCLCQSNNSFFVCVCQGSAAGRDFPDQFSTKKMTSSTKWRMVVSGSILGPLLTLWVVFQNSSGTERHSVYVANAAGMGNVETRIQSR